MKYPMKEQLVNAAEYEKGKSMLGGKGDVFRPRFGGI